MLFKVVPVSHVVSDKLKEITRIECFSSLDDDASVVQRSKTVREALVPCTRTVDGRACSADVVHNVHDTVRVNRS